MPQICPLQPEHLPACLTLAQQMHRESNFSSLAFDPERMAMTLAGCITDANNCGFVAIEEGQVIGGILGRISQADFGPDRIANDRALFVTPDRRGARTGLLLVQAYIDWAKSRGAKRINFSPSTGVAPERTRKLLEHAGFQAVGHSMMLET